MSHDDPVEFIGSDRTVKADPVPLRVVPAPVVAAEPVVAPERKSHPKHAKLRPRREWEKAQAETADARLELQAATAALRTAEKAEGNALADWIKLNPPPSADEVYRQHVAGQQAERAVRVAAGLDPDAKAAPVISKSPIV